MLGNFVKNLILLLNLPKRYISKVQDFYRQATYLRK